jgi:hypothetical protein
MLVPHLEQNFVLSEILFPHFGQFMIISRKYYLCFFNFNFSIVITRKLDKKKFLIFSERDVNLILVL